MNIEIIEPCGYSKTLNNLLNVAYQARTSFRNSNIVLLGGLLNGEHAKNELSRLNIVILDIPYEGFADYLKKVDREAIIITSPYGTEQKLFKIMKKRKIIYFDATSPSTLDKEKLIKKARFGKKVIFVGNINTVEENYLAKSTNHRFFFYDLNTDSPSNAICLNKRNNKKSTQIIYQSEIANDSLSMALYKIKTYLPKAVINHEVSDENYDKKKTLLEKLKDNDVLLIISSSTKTDKYIEEYYHLNEKNISYAVISDVPGAIALNIEVHRKIYVTSDGSVSRKTIEDIYNYFRYRGIQGDLLDQQVKSVVQNL